MARTLPSASDEIVTWSTAASVPTTSIERRTEFFSTCATVTGRAALSAPRACAVSDFEQALVPSARRASIGTAAGRPRDRTRIMNGRDMDSRA